MPRNVNELQGPNDLAIYYTGPVKEKGPLPAVFYFALSGEDSLSLDPYNQLIQFLDDSNIRCFSFTLPGHGVGLKNTDALAFWAKEYQEGKEPIAHFLSQASENIHYLLKEGWLEKGKIALAGLSRGGFLTALLSLMVEIPYVLCFAPIINLSVCEEFQSAALAVVSEKYDLKNLANHFIKKNLRIYVGNRDLKISTDLCYQFVRTVVDQAFEQGVRSAPTELILSPSIGHLGHGTPPHAFRSGADWLKGEFTHGL